MFEHELVINEIVSSGVETAETYIVPDGKMAKVFSFGASIPDSPMTVAKLVWDYGGAGETDLWILHRHGELANREFIFTVQGDGIKKLALVCDNGCNDAYYFNAYIKMRVK